MHTSTDGAAARGSRLRMSDLESLNREEFANRVGGLFEGSPWIAAAAWETRPWGSRQALHRALVDVVDAAGEERHVALDQGSSRPGRPRRVGGDADEGLDGRAAGGRTRS